MTYTVTQEDREAAGDTYEAGHIPDPCCPPKLIARKMREGKLDDSSYVQAFAKHRTEATKELVEALRPFADTTVLEPNGVLVGLERLHFDRARTTISRATGGQS